MSSHPLSTSTTTTLTTHKVHLTHDVDEASIHVFKDLLTEEECLKIIEQNKDLVPSNVSPETVRSRQVFEDAELAERVWRRIEGFWGGGVEGEERMSSQGKEEKVKGVVVDGDGERWRVSRLNERWRLCCYDVGGKFSPHQDTRHFPSINTQSFMTLNIYLTTLPSPSNGATRFFTSSPYTTPSVLSSPAFKSEPLRGSGVMFRDYVWHDGEEVKKGRKYLLRTDVMYERMEEWSEERVWQGLGHEEKGRKALRIAEGLEDSGSSEEAIRWYKKAYKLWPDLQHGGQ